MYRTVEISGRVPIRPECITVDEILEETRGIVNGSSDFQTVNQMGQVPYGRFAVRPKRRNVTELAVDSM
jgi:hypothetical protein